MGLRPQDFKSRASAISPRRPIRTVYDVGAVVDVMEATAGIEPAVRVLQTPALPLGYVALQKIDG